MNEIWKDIEGYEGIYQVSNLGHIRSLARITPHGHTRKQRLLKLSKNTDGRLQVILYKVRRTGFLIHRLVLVAFVGPCPDGMECCHLDGDPTNNKLDNLEWNTKSVNCGRDRNKHLNYSSKYNGVSLHKTTGKWKAYISVAGKTKHLGLFDTEIQAAIVVKKHIVDNNLPNYYHEEMPA